MEHQDILNAIAVLTGSIDPLARAEEKEVVKVISKKILELVKRIK